MPMARPTKLDMPPLILAFSATKLFLAACCCWFCWLFPNSIGQVSIKSVWPGIAGYQDRRYGIWLPTIANLGIARKHIDTTSKKQSQNADPHFHFSLTIVKSYCCLIIIFASLVFTLRLKLLCLQLLPFAKFRLTYKVGAPIPITGVQFGMRIEFGYDCLIPADFNNDVSFKFVTVLTRTTSVHKWGNSMVISSYKKYL